MWIELTPTLLKTHLAKDEIAALATVQVPACDLGLDAILAEECANVAAMWRSKIRLYHSIDRRPRYVPGGLLEYILVHLRYACYTRLPAMGQLLDELRRAEWQRANEVMDNVRKWAIDPVDPEEEEPPAVGVPSVIPNGLAWRFERFEGFEGERD